MSYFCPVPNFSLFLFCLTCSFSDLACINFLVYFMLPCLFFIQACIFLSTLCLFAQNLFQKRHNPLFSFPSSLSGTTIVYCLYFYSFSIHFHDHLASILNVSVGFLFLFYLFLFCLTCSFSDLACSFFCFTCSFSDLACINLLVYFMLPCLFFLYKLVSFLSTLCLFFSNFYSKKTQPLFPFPFIPVGHNFFDISFYNSFFSSSICVALILVKAKSRLPASFNDAPMR